MGFISDTLASVGLNEFVVTLMFVNAILAMSIYLTLYGGMFSLANAGFMAIGSYVSVILTQNHDWPFLPAILAGMVVAGLIAIPIGLPVLRLRDIYLAIATIGFVEITRIVILNFDKIIAEAYTRLHMTSEPPKITNGPLGIIGIPVETKLEYLVATVIILSYFMIRMHRSRFGRALAAIRQDENVAASQGINVVYYKNVAFILGAMMAGLGGGFSGHLSRIIQPGSYGFGTAVDILAYSVLGGITSWYGPILGGLALTALPEVLRPLKEYTGLINGVVLLIFIAYLPGGLGDPALWRSVRKTFNRLVNFINKGKTADAGA